METISDIILRVALKAPHAIAVRHRETALTYQELAELVQRAAAWIAHETLPAEVVSLHAENSPEWIAAYLGIIYAGRIANPIGLRVADGPFLSQLGFSRSRVLLYSAQLEGRVERLALPKEVQPMVLSKLFSEVKSKVAYPACDYASLLYTSGTTGAPKAIRLTHQIVLCATRNIIERLRLKSNEICYQILPLSHSFGLGNMHATLMLGGTVVLASQTINYEEWLSEMKMANSTFFAATPFTLSILVKHYAEIFFSAKKLRTLCTNTGPMTPAVTKRVLDELPYVCFFTYYGLTEASRSTIIELSANPNKLTSVGTPVRDASVIIMENPGKEAPANIKGEVWIRGPHAIREYWNNPAENTQRFVNGYLKTGDIGYKDTDGFLFITGRIDDIVNIAGEKVSLQEVDLTIAELPFVADVMCVERPDERQEFVIEAHVVFDAHAEISPEQARKAIIAYCRQRLDNYKIPRIIRFVDSLPRTDSGKAQRKTLRAQLHDE